MGTAALIVGLLVLLKLPLFYARDDPELQTGQLLACNESSVTSCRAFLFHDEGDINQTSNQVADLYGVQQSNVSAFPMTTTGFIVSVNCTCFAAPVQGFSARVQYQVMSNNSTLQSISAKVFDNMVDMSSQTPGVQFQAGENVELALACGCPWENWEFTLSYQIQVGDTLNALASRFSSDVSSIKSLNKIANENYIYPNIVIFIPTHNDLLSQPTQTNGNRPYSGLKKKIITIGVVAGIVGATVLIGFSLAAMYCFCPKRSMEEGYNYKNMREFSWSQRLTSGSSRRNSGSLSSFTFSTHRQSSSINQNVKHNIPAQREASNIFDREKPIVFNYEDVVKATDSFDASRKLGHGSFGSVFSAFLSNHEVAIKRMKASKSKEFLAELKVLCTVHHTNLVELLGFSIGEDDLLLVYEAAKHGDLSQWLHEPLEKGYVPLSWTKRLQIALDSARGLEYIHEHTKTHYVHRDIKTSNILLDEDFRAKIADFGLAKLIVHTEDEDSSTTRVVGTFGYLAPEYVRDGYATSKSDVYAFGVVLMELIAGQRAILKTESNPDPQSPHSKSLVSVMLSALQDTKSNEKLSTVVDPNLGDGYPEDAVFKVAQLAKYCVQEDPVLRPDMRDVVFVLSQTLVSSMEWEACVAGSNQIFSDLLEGR